MTFEAWLSGPPQILPAQILWIVALALCFAFAFVQSLPRRDEIRPTYLLFTGVILLLAVPAGAFLYLRFPSTGPATVPGVPLTPVAPLASLAGIALLLFAGAFLGRMPALLAGLVMGLIRCLLDTHLLSTAVEYALVGWAVAWFLRQDYSGRLFTVLRQPWGASLGAGFLLTLLRFGSEMGSASGSLVTLFDYALVRSPGQWPAIWMECIAGAVPVEMVRLALASHWPEPRRLRQTRYHRSLAWKVSLWLTVPIAAMALTMTALVVTDARSQAQAALREKVRSAAEVARTDIPMAMTTGHTLLEGMSGNFLQDDSDSTAVRSFLGNHLSHPAFFEQAAYLRADGEQIAVYPDGSAPFCQSAEEAQGCALARRGITWHGWVPSDIPRQPWISFAQPVPDTDGGTRGILVGRTSLATNPLLKTVKNSFASMEGGQGLILDADNRVLYPPEAEPWGEDTPVESESSGGAWYSGTMPGGGTRISYLLPLGYPAWKVGIRVPEAAAFRSALETGLHTGLFALLMALLTEALALLIAQQITSPLRRLAESAGMIAAGDMERFVAVGGEDEIGQLGRSLEAMRRNLRRQMRDQETLLTAGQGMASNPSLAHAMDILLHSVKAATGAPGIRVILAPGQITADADVPLLLGDAAQALQPIADRILAIVRERTPWTVNRFSGADDGLFELLPPDAGALIAVRIERATTLYGALCIVYQEPQAFEVGLLELLAGFANQGAMAIANSRLLEATEGERAQLSAILEAIPEGVLVVDSESRLQYANPTAEDLLGTPLRGFGLPAAESIPLPALARFLAEPAAHPHGMDLEGADGRMLQIVARNVQGAGSGEPWQVCVLQDVTRLRELDELKSEFVHTVSHDLRRPLTMIEGQVHMVEMLGPLNAAQQDYARRIRLSAQHMNRLVKDLLDLGRVESGVEIRRAPVRIAEIAGRVVEELRPEAAAGNVRLTAEIPDMLPDLSADASLLERALGNLIENAVRFNRPGGTATVTAAVARDSMVIAVRDTGIGIAPADQPRIFEKFFRVNPRDDPEHPAWGLGLAIVKSVAEWHGGRVWFESRLGQGSTFYLALPLRT